MSAVEAHLAALGISYKVHSHPPVFTCEELEKYSVPGLSCKNLFLRDQKKRRYFLVIFPAAKKTDLVMLGKSLGEPKLSFVSPNTLKEKLGVEPGAVSPFGLIYNTARDVEVYIDQEVMDAPLVHFHPNRNTASLEMSIGNFRRYLNTLKNAITILK
jgi:Ala-tRNA(Pro) deacylase